ncbi:MAG TPA: glycoside hydrolase family 97 N-terminal domain-containing protein [Tepidisphaeraceae bacterium]|nr:glycoside hydrolase family 97 N-terminal domain-containing protein [Tepidisphaeraceae bacterium]
MMRPLIAFSFVVMTVAASAAHAQLREPLSVRSPQRQVEIRLLPDEARLRFVVIMDGVTVIEPSPMVFTVDGVDLADGAMPNGVRQNYAVNEEYPILGAHALAVNYCNGIRQPMKHGASGQEFTIDLRAYGDGVAFRFVVPGATDKERVPDETTTFTLPAGTTVWSHDLRGHDEATYERRDAAVLDKGTWHAPPVMFKLSGGTYGAITEANLINYSGMALQADGQRGLRIGLAHRQPVSHPYEPRYKTEDVARLSQPGAIKGTITTPWRVVMLAKDLNQLANTDLIPNLNPPPDETLFPEGPLTSWVLPGRAVWRHLDKEAETPGAPGANSPDERTTTGPTTRPTTRPAAAAADRPSPPAPSAQEVTVQVAQAAAPAEPGAANSATTSTTATRGTTTTTGATTTTSTGPATRPLATSEEMRGWSELAGKLGFEYSILEPFWSRWSPEELKDLVESSRVQGVGIWVSLHSRDVRTVEQRKEMFQRCADAGVVGLKIDFFGHEHKEVVDLHQAILREAAEHKLLLSLHGASNSTGASRTWPNQLARDAIGARESRLKERAFQHSVLPFTRFSTGQGGSTVMLDSRRGDTTLAHQLATPIVFTAPLLTYADHPKRLLESPASDVIREIPPVWDQTIVLPPSEIGESAVFARRLGDRWFVGVLNGSTARQLKLPLTFLGEGRFVAILVRDGETAKTITVEKNQPLSAQDTLAIHLPAGGGFVGAFVRKEE